MAFLQLENLTKNFGDVSAVKDVTLEINRGEFFGLLGISGSGKTTLIKIIAGLELPSAGKVLFDGADITNLAPDNRDISVVLQNQSLIQPRLSAFENVALGLKGRQLSDQLITAKVKEALDLVKLTFYKERFVNELSSGEQQRVAVARAIATQSQLLLFDEPLSNLDIAMREEVRDQLRLLIKNLGLTVIYVTQDQDEAFAFCDRIGVMDNGRMLQIGTPRDLYQNPKSVAVGRFFGRNNLILAAPVSSGKTRMPEFQTLTGNHKLFVDKADKADPAAFGQTVTLAIRPENVVLPFGAAFPEDNLFKAKVVAVNYFGATTRIVLDANGLRLEALVLRLVGLNVGDDCMVSLPPNRISILKG